MKKRFRRRRPRKEHPSPPPKLSEVLRVLLQNDSGDSSVTINYLLSKTQGQGIFLTVILLTLPFLVPLLPGINTPFGAAIMYLAWREIRGKKEGLPAWMGDRPISSQRFSKIISGTMKLIRFIESGVKPRFSWWMMLPGMQKFHWGLIGFLAFLLALPLPVPATNTFPAFALVFVAATAMERDGKMIWLGYFLSLLSLAWIAGAVLLGEQLVSFVFGWLKGILG